MYEEFSSIGHGGGLVTVKWKGIVPAHICTGALRIYNWLEELVPVSLLFADVMLHACSYCPLVCG